MASLLVEPVVLALVVFALPGFGFSLFTHRFNPTSQVPKKMLCYALMQAIYPVFCAHFVGLLLQGAHLTELDNAVTVMPKQGSALFGVAINTSVVFLQIRELFTHAHCFEHRLILGFSLAASSSHALTHCCASRFWMNTFGRPFIVLVNCQTLASVAPFLRAATGEEGTVTLAAAVAQRTLHYVILYAIILSLIPNSVIMYVVLFQSNLPDFVAYSPPCVGSIIRPAVLPPAIATLAMASLYVAFEMFALASHMRPDLFDAALPASMCLNDVFDIINPIHWWCLRIPLLRWIFNTRGKELGIGPKTE